jgi:hypothetical protein
MLEGENAQIKAQGIKKIIRSKYTNELNRQSRNIKNVIHVADPEDFPKSLHVLFLGGLSVESSGST